jgi:hypothetical protein
MSTEYNPLLVCRRCSTTSIDENKFTLRSHTRHELAGHIRRVNSIVEVYRCISCAKDGVETHRQYGNLLKGPLLYEGELELAGDL